MPSDETAIAAVRGGRACEKVHTDLADHAHRRQDHDVDGRVRVEPEQVLEQHRIAAQRGIEDAELVDVVDPDEQQRRGRAPASRGA